MYGLNDLKHKRICILGCGKTGISAIVALKKANAKVYAYDDNEIYLKKICDEYSVEAFSNQEIDILFVSPGIPNNKLIRHKLIESNQFIPIISDIEILQCTHKNAKYIGITGTNGKSTTTSLIGEILQNNDAIVCGNIGNPVLSMNKASIYVVELSSYQLDLIQDPKLNVAICLNITPDHLDHYMNIYDYAQSKARIFHNDSINIISVDYDICKNIAKDLKNCIPISREITLQYGISILNNVLIINNCFNVIGQKEYILPNNLALAGKYNAENIAAAVAACLAMNVNIETILNGIQNFKGLPHRMERIQVNNITFINDSKATNCASTKAALSSLNNHRIIWIAGGVYKDGALESLREFFPLIDKAYLIGESTDEFFDILTKYGVAAEKSFTLENALNSTVKNLSNQVVLLSPACASTDQWKNFEERGNFFRSSIEKIFSDD